MLQSCIILVMKHFANELCTVIIASDDFFNTGKMSGYADFIEGGFNVFVSALYKDVVHSSCKGYRISEASILLCKKAR